MATCANEDRFSPRWLNANIPNAGFRAHYFLGKLFYLWKPPEKSSLAHAVLRPPPSNMRAKARDESTGKQPGRVVALAVWEEPRVCGNGRAAGS